MAQLLILERPFDPAFVPKLGVLVRSIFGEFDVTDLTPPKAALSLAKR